MLNSIVFVFLGYHAPLGFFPTRSGDRRGEKSRDRIQGGPTALIDAAYRGRANYVQLLLEHGADKEAKNNVRVLSAVDFEDIILCKIVFELLSCISMPYIS
jgi:hypothetical protein